MTPTCSRTRNGQRGQLPESINTLPDFRVQDPDYAEATAHLTEDHIAAVAWISIAISAFNGASIVNPRPVPRQAPGLRRSRLTSAS